MGPIRTMFRSIGMGGPASMLLWNIGYDPIVDAIGGPTYVDDLAALNVGPTRTLRAQYFLLAAGLAAGLRIAAHTCVYLAAAWVHPAARRVLRALPLQWISGPQGTIIKGLPPHLIDRIARATVGCHWARGARSISGPCRCTVNSVVVPQQLHQRWREAMRHIPFGRICVQSRARYLGARLEAPTTGRLAIRGTWGTQASLRLAQSTWNMCMTTVRCRIEALLASPTSATIRAKQWNCFCVSCIPYPAQIAPPSPQDVAGLIRCFRQATNGDNWGPWWLPAALGVHWSIPGAPRCPIAVQQAAAAIATLSARPWGNSVTVEVQRRSLRALMQYATNRADHGTPGSAEKDAAGVVQCYQLLQDNGRAQMWGKGGALYRTAWRSRREGPLRNWLANTARRCRWLDDAGAEWELLSHTKHYNAAHHVLRLLAGGAHTGARHRNATTRPEHPHICVECGSDQVQLNWRTPHPEREELAWCQRCLPFGGRAPARDLLTELAIAEGWAAAPGQRPDPDAILGALTRRGDGTGYDWGPSPYGPCPLCGCGEAGSQHILRWCPAVATAWANLQQDGTTLDEATRVLLGSAPDATALLHQAAYLNSTLSGRAAVCWTTGARLLTAAARAYTRDYNGEDEVEGVEDSPRPGVGLQRFSLFGPRSITLTAQNAGKSTLTYCIIGTTTERRRSTPPTPANGARTAHGTSGWAPTSRYKKGRRPRRHGLRKATTVVRRPGRPRRRRRTLAGTPYAAANVDSTGDTCEPSGTFGKTRRSRFPSDTRATLAGLRNTQELSTLLMTEPGRSRDIKLLRGRPSSGDTTPTGSGDPIARARRHSPTRRAPRC